MGKVASSRQVQQRQSRSPSERERIYSRSQMEAQGKFHEKDEASILKLHPLGILLIIVGFLPGFYLMIKYWGSGEEYWPWVVFLVILGLVGFLGGLALNRFRLQIQYEYLNTDIRARKNIAVYLAAIISLIASIEILLYFLKVVLRFTLAGVDMYFYYIMAAIMEELFFRYFLTSLLYLKTRLSKVPILIPFITALAFMLIHLGVYGNNPTMLLAMYFGGVIFALFFLVFQDISITITAHVFINIISVIIMTNGLMISA